ncbi:type III-B CRISPR module-associated protein Cmr5 [Aquisalimonas sp.]|uniref:type III-B CRISPR module-associated protein Cmr5 n=1 Tax=Aquisalimonas sp. TaxID=1872621 RepID=UPI0025BA8CC7|nr:type III-B CRISPR module-associated protein Cmr5 [Aquisalimonas sp.]
MTMTMEQQRARSAWRCSAGQPSDYATLAKKLPALIMNSGLMQTLAFLEDKNQGHHRALSSHLRRWLQERFPELFQSAEYVGFMESLMRARPEQFQDVTAEAMAWLRWVRQLAPTRANGEGSR